MRLTQSLFSCERAVRIRAGASCANTEMSSHKRKEVFFFFVFGLLMAGIESSKQETSDVHVINRLYGQNMSLDCNYKPGIWYHGNQYIGRTMSLQSMTLEMSGLYQCRLSQRVEKQFELHVFGVMGLTPLSCDEPSNDICKKNVIRGDEVTLCVNLTTFPASVDDKYRPHVLNITRSYWYKLNNRQSSEWLSYCQNMCKSNSNGTMYSFHGDARWRTCMNVANVTEDSEFSFQFEREMVTWTGVFPSTVLNRMTFSIHVINSLILPSSSSSSSSSSWTLSTSSSNTTLNSSPPPLWLAAIVIPATVVVILLAILSVISCVLVKIKQGSSDPHSSWEGDDYIDVNPKTPSSSTPCHSVLRVLDVRCSDSKFDLNNELEEMTHFNEYTQSTESICGYSLSPTEELGVPSPSEGDPPQEGDPRTTRPGTLPLRDLGRNHRAAKTATHRQDSNTSSQPLIVNECVEEVPEQDSISCFTVPSVEDSGVESLPASTPGLGGGVVGGQPPDQCGHR